MSERFILIWSCRLVATCSQPPSTPQILPAHAGKSGAVCIVIGSGLRGTDVDSMKFTARGQQRLRLDAELQQRQPEQ